MQVRKEELLKIYNWLKKNLTKEDIEWLRRNRSASWEWFEKSNIAKWEKKYIKSGFQLSLRIQEIINSKLKSHEIKYSIPGLGKSFLWHIVKLLELDDVSVSIYDQNYQLLDAIIIEIDKRNERASN